MAGKTSLPPEAGDAIEIGDEIAGLRNEVAAGCTRLLAQARKVNADLRGNGFNLKFWEGRISSIRETQLATFSVNELNRLRHECNEISHRLAAFGKV